MNSRRIIVTNPEGIHLRVAAEIAKISGGNEDTTVVVENAGKSPADGRSILELLLLEAEIGSSLEVRTAGPHENTVMARICDLFEDGSGI